MGEENKCACPVCGGPLLVFREIITRKTWTPDPKDPSNIIEETNTDSNNNYMVRCKRNYEHIIPPNIEAIHNFIQSIIKKEI